MFDGRGYNPRISLEGPCLKLSSHRRDHGWPSLELSLDWGVVDSVDNVHAFFTSSSQDDGSISLSDDPMSIAKSSGKASFIEGAHGYEVRI